MKETSYYELKMPDSNDTIDVSVLNNNMKRLDDVLILTVIGRTAETSEFVKKCCAPYIMIQNLGEETVTIYDRRWPEDMWEDNKIVIEPTKFYTYKVANSVNANFLVLDNKECNFRYFITAEQAIAEGGGGGGGGTTDYNELDNQPKVNGIVLVGNKSFKELGLLNDDGKIKSDYLPPFVDNMDSYDTEADFPRPGVEDRLYLDKSTNLAYVWAGTDYACIGTPLALGITHETAGYGDESRAAYNHSLSEHARVDATKTEASSVNGKIKINGTDVDVYTHPQAEGQEATNPHGTTASDVGLGNLLNAKQVTVTEQAYSDTEKAQARNNIGAGTSSFSGKYSDLAEIPSEFTPAEHNHDDLYAHKTSVSSGENSTTSVINVTDAKAQMAMIKSISGKTYKRNLFDINGNVTTKADGTTLAGNTVSGNVLTSTINGGSYVPSGQVISVKANTTYTLSAIASATSGGSPASTDAIGSMIVYPNGSVSSRLANYTWTKADVGKMGTQTFNTGSSTQIVVTFCMRNVTSTSYTNIQFEEGSVANPYVPFGLISTPVESVVSQGENICNVESPTISSNTVLTAVNDNTFTLTSTGVWTTWNVECDVIPNKQYRINYNLIASTGSAGKLYVRSKDGSTNLLDIDFNTVGASTKTFTPTENKIQVRIYPNNSATSANYSKTFKLAVVPSTESGTVYPPYNKTTVLVPSSVKNLPDYGCSVGDIANEIDFENGVYYHRVAKSVPLNWQLTSGYFFTSTLTNKKNGDSNFIHPLLSIGGLNVGAAEIPSGCARGNTSSYNIYARDTSITTAAAFNEKYGVPVIYELATTEVIPLADYLRPLPVEVGGTITLVNPYNLDVNSTIKYKKEVN